MSEKKLLLAPCFKYAARQVTSVDELMLMAKCIFTLYENKGYRSEDILPLYMSLSQELSPELASKLFSYNDEELDIETYYFEITGSKNIPNFKTCVSFIKNNYPSTSGVCRICEFSKNYSNSHFDIELSLYRYANESLENLIHFKEVAEKSIFKSHYDFADGLSSPNPFVLPILKLCFNELQKNPTSFFIDGSTNSSRFDKALTMILLVNSKYRESVDELINISISSIDIQKKILVKMLEDAYMPSGLIEVQELIQKVKTKKDKSTQITLNDIVCEESINIEQNATDTNESTFSSDESYQSEDYTYAPDYSSIPNDLFNVSESDIVPPPIDYDGDSMDFNGSIIDIPDDIPESAFQDNSEDASQLAGFKEPEIPGEIDTPLDEDNQSEKNNISIESAENNDAPPESERQKNTKKTPTSNSKNIEDPNKQNNETNNKNTKVSRKKKKADNNNIEDISSTKKYSSVPAARSKTIFLCAINKNFLTEKIYSVNELENELFASISKTKTLPVEIICDENSNFYFIFWCKELGTFAFCPVSKVPNTINALLTHKSIQKICWQPYYLYSLTKEQDINIRNVYSIYSFDRVVYPAAPPEYYHDVITSYTKELEEPEGLGSPFEEFNYLIRDMQFYEIIRRFQMRSEAGITKKLYEKVCAEDEVMGNSFLRRIVLNDKTAAFELDANGQFVFNENYNIIPKYDGYILTYSIESNGIDDIVQVYVDALSELALTGRFRKIKMQILTISRNQMHMFIEEKGYELCVTLMQNYFNKYAITHAKNDFNLIVSHERYLIGDKKKVGDGKLLLPSSLTNALDVLTTANLIIKTNAKHIRGPETDIHQKRYRQKETYPTKKK